MLLDADLLLYAVDRSSPHHEAAAEWWGATLSGDVRIALPWQTVGAFVRISTHPRLLANPLSGPDAWSFVAEWLELDHVWVPTVSRHTCEILGRLITTHRVGGNLVPDAQLAAMAIEHAISVASADSDFARFPEVTWINPVAT